MDFLQICTHCLHMLKSELIKFWRCKGYCGLWVQFYCCLLLLPFAKVMKSLAFVHLLDWLLLCKQCNSKTYWWVFFKFSYICLSKRWLNFGYAHVTVAYFKVTLKFTVHLSGRRSVFYKLQYHCKVIRNMPIKYSLLFSSPNVYDFKICATVNFKFCCSRVK